MATMQQTADLEPQDPQRQLRLARTLLGTGQLAEAEEAARRAAELQPELVEAHDLLSVIMERQHRTAEAVAAAQRAADLLPQDAGRQHRIGMLLFQSGDMAGAEQALKHAMRLAPQPQTFHNHHLLGIALERQGRLDEAIAEARKASDLAPENPDLLARVAAILRSAKRSEEAEAFVRKAISIRPDAEQPPASFGNYHRGTSRTGSAGSTSGDRSRCTVRTARAQRADGDRQRSVG